MDKFIRARSGKQKKIRINEILEATSRLMEMLKYDEITFSLIAKEADFTRSNLYKYFNSKEEIFIEFLKHDLEIWVKDFIENFKLENPKQINDFVNFWVKSQLKHKRLLKLVSILYIHIEKNITEESLISFKKLANQSMIKVSKVLMGNFKKLTFEKINQFVHLQFASAIGLHQMTQLSNIQNKILQFEEFKHFKIDFEEYYHNSVKILFEGILNS